MTTDNNKHLHFHIRHDGYEQTIGYGHFLNRVLSVLNEENPHSAKTLLERTARLLLNPPDNHIAIFPEKQQKDGHVFMSCVPPEIGSRLTVFSKQFQSGEKTPEMLFGPAMHPYFGLLDKDFFAHRKEVFEKGVINLVTQNRITSKAHGCPNVTHAATQSGSYRAYMDTLNTHYGVKPGAIPNDFKLEFDYPIPTDDPKQPVKMLPLMKIGTPQSLEQDFRNQCYGDKQTIEDYMVAPFVGKYQMGKDGKKLNIPEQNKYTLVFLHPQCHAEHFDDLTKCIAPLLHEIDTPSTIPVSNGTPLPENKEDAAATIYWLLAQSTPVVRGGSAYANIILEHVAHRLREQGYDYDIPYTKPGIDLWAQAACLPLEDKGNLKGFKTRFKEKDGLFFDHAAKDEDIERYLIDKLQQTEIGRAVFADKLQMPKNRPPNR